MFLKKMIMICLILMFVIQVAPAQTAESIAYYIGHARNLISQAITLGHPRGYQKIMTLNRDNGAWGAAEWVARRNPQDAVQIMIEAGRALINIKGLWVSKRFAKWVQSF